jgi:hypothetical protein
MATLVGTSVLANMFDTVFPSYSSGCGSNAACAKWSDIRNATAIWANQSAMLAAGNSCAMPALPIGHSPNDSVLDSFSGPWCYCTGGERTHDFCDPPSSSVEQLNLQLAHGQTVVASFITYEAMPSDPPVAMLGTAPSLDDAVTLHGLTHDYKPPTAVAHADYQMHFVKFTGLKPRTHYYYKVKSGSAECGWSEVYSFRSAYAAADGGVTRVAIFGDMGHDRYNNVGNLAADCAAGTIDAIVLMGDHAYNLGDDHDRRGDAYMNMLQPLLSRCPWFPIIGDQPRLNTRPPSAPACVLSRGLLSPGNHEVNDGDHFNHYLKIAWGEEYGAQRGGFSNPPVRSTATTTLGDFITKGTMYASAHGVVPSNTSRFTSLDIGLMHLVGLDLNSLDAPQLAWLEADLQAGRNLPNMGMASCGAPS